MKIEQIENPIDVNILKSSIPIIFLDSNLIIEINKVLKNKSDSKKEIIEIFELLKDLSKSNKILIPYADQEEEIDYKNNNSNNISVLHNLSNGNRFKNFLIIQEEQQNKLFQAFLSNTMAVNFDYREGFDEINKKTKDEKIFVKGILNLFGKNIVDILQEEKLKRTHELLEYQKRINKNETFKEHLFKELTYEGYILFRNIVVKFESGIELTQTEKEHWYNFLSYVKKYHLQGHLTDQLLKYSEYLLSFYWFAVPHIDIERNINTYISLYDKFRQGDYQDTINASCYLPYCNYYYTDKNMCRILKDLGFDKKYNVKIYSFKTIKELILELQQI